LCHYSTRSCASTSSRSSRCMQRCVVEMFPCPSNRHTPTTRAAFLKRGKTPEGKLTSLSSRPGGPPGAPPATPCQAASPRQRRHQPPEFARHTTAIALHTISQAGGVRAPSRLGASRVVGPLNLLHCLLHKPTPIGWTRLESDGGF